jgi:hypothetical protein
MSIRYELPSDDPHERRKASAERDAEWEALAADAIQGDPRLRRWKATYWVIAWFLAVVVFAGTMLLAVTTLDLKRASGKALGAPFAMGSFVVSVGYWLYLKRVRRIALAAWSRKREEEVRRERALRAGN